MQRTGKSVAIYSGGDWNDASCEHLLIPEDMDLDKEHELHRKWYTESYVPGKMKFLDFTEWLISKGAKKDESIQEYWEH